MVAGSGRTSIARNIATFAPISAFSAVESGPGPKENDEADNVKDSGAWRELQIVHPDG